jgi:hypothetical protein
VGKELVDACSAAATRGTGIGSGGEDGHCELVGGRWGCHDGKIELDAMAVSRLHTTNCSSAGQ